MTLMGIVMLLLLPISIAGWFGFGYWLGRLHERKAR